MSGSLPLTDRTNVYAKRMKSKKRTDLETTYAHAAQIFCEMLGQVCHKELYENVHTNFQEVVFPLPFSPDNRHLSFMRDMQRAISFMRVFQTTISGILSRMVRNTLQIQRTQNM